MGTQDVFYTAQMLPLPGRRFSAWPLWLLALLPLCAGLPLPSMPDQAQGSVHGKGTRRDPFAIDFKDGHRLVCEGCRSLSARMEHWKWQIAPAPAAVRPASLELQGEPARRQPADSAVPIGTVHQPLSPVASRSTSAYVHGTSFSEDVRQLLPRYRPHFEEAARRNRLDWRLLAAVGYQESRWNPAAESPTGVRGLMMLTTDTALDLGVDRDDGPQSILGAGRLLQSLYEQLPAQIREPDRTFMALAAYNQGIGHLLDARDVVVNRGGDPDRWADVRAALPLLGDPNWQATTKYGAARGDEAVAFVDSVRDYYARLKEMAPAEAAGEVASAL